MHSTTRGKRRPAQSCFSGMATWISWSLLRRKNGSYVDISNSQELLKFSSEVWVGQILNDGGIRGGPERLHTSGMLTYNLKFRIYFNRVWQSAQAIQIFQA
jgi:hypothetical protein